MASPRVSRGFTSREGGESFPQNILNPASDQYQAPPKIESWLLQQFIRTLWIHKHTAQYIVFSEATVQFNISVYSVETVWRKTIGCFFR